MNGVGAIADAALKTEHIDSEQHQKIKENTQSQIKLEKNNSMKVDKELKNKSQNKQNENALDSLIEI